ncbi:MAG: NAD(P)H-dependent glycerol-3-phosphate dehydrogenase [Rikenellaceae bacterium]
MELQISAESSCAVIGYGSWATAIVKILSQRGSNIGWYIPNIEILEGLLTEERNIKYLRDVDFDLSKLHPSSDINAVVENHDIIIFAMPSAYIKKFMEPLKVSLKNKFVVSAVKGIVPQDYTTVVEYIHRHYELPYKQIGIITGPSHAEEVAIERLSYLTVVCPDIDLAHVVGSKVECHYIKVSFSTDLYGVEYATILKNIYAISVGMAVGLGYGDNFIAVLIANAAREMHNFLDESYPMERDTREAAYLGDLLVTCYSTYSRNRRLGLLIGKGFTTKSALNEMTMVAEGYFAADCIRHVNLQHEISMPIADMVYNVLYKGASARKSMKNLTKLLK